MNSVISLVLVVFSQSLTKGYAIEVKVRCDDNATIYLDGLRAGETEGWKDVWTADIGGKSRLIAIRCYNRGGPGWLAASFGEKVVTDETWRCRGDTGTYWYGLDTNDSSLPWVNAYVVPSENMKDTLHTFPDSAEGIWRESNIRSSYSLCRQSLGVSVDFRFTSYGAVYSDGEEMFRQTDDIQGMNIIPRTTRVVAIVGWRHSEKPLLEAVFSNGFGTDTSWKCTDTEETNWKTTNFNDSHWDQAVDQGQNGIGAASKVRKISTAIANSGVIYCRGHIECGCKHMCDVDENQYDFRCVCPVGYVVGEDGFSCDMDVCWRQNGGCKHICVNTAGTYTCKCRPGYELSTDMHSCINIDECDINEHNCSSVCKDTQGSFECTCPEGFTLQEDKSSCGDINECKDNNGNCAQICNNTIGSYTCGCTLGYESASDLNSCSNINECDIGTHNCIRPMVCEDTKVSFNCVCPVGYTDTDIAACQDIDECEPPDNPCQGGCMNTAGSYLCNCSGGYILADDGHACFIRGDGGRINTGMIAGVVVAFIIIAIVVILMVALLIRRRMRHNSEEASQDPLNHAYYNVGRAEDNAGAQANEPLHDIVYYNVDQVDSLNETPYNKAILDEAEKLAVSQEDVSRSQDTEQVGTGKIEPCGNASQEPPHVYYNVGRVDQEDEVTYENVAGVGNPMGPAATGGETSQPNKGQEQSVYSSLSRETRDDEDASLYTQLDKF